jgi:hypothetical protein
MKNFRYNLTLVLLLLVTSAYNQHPFEQKWALACIPATRFEPAKCDILNFSKEGLSILRTDSIDQRAGVFRSNASICDSAGNLLLTTNGQVVSDYNFFIIPNGDTLANTRSFSSYYGGFPFFNGTMIIPCPGDANSYYVLLQSNRLLDDEVDFPLWIFPHIYYAKVTFSENGPMVVCKDNLLSDNFSSSGIISVKHANNRFWWIMFLEALTNHKVFYLLDDEGMHYHHTDSIGMAAVELGRCCNFLDGAFSAQGDRLALFNSGLGLQLFSFNRESGKLSDFEHFEVPIFLTASSGGTEFSPSGRFLYFNDFDKIWQMDLWASDKAESIIWVAEHDYYVWRDIWPTEFFQMQRTPDCRIAISTSSSTPYIHIIQEPDQPGLLCRFEHRAIELTINYSIGLPNYPNFCLGEPCENYCDSLLQVSTREIHDRGIQVSIWPNPVSDQLNVQWEQEGRITRLLLHDMNGRVVRTQQVQGQAQCGIWMQDLPLGFYMLTVEDSYGYVYREKIIKR